MVLVEVFVPSLGRRYDFSLDEGTSVRVLIQEMLEVVGQKEHCEFFDLADKIALYSTRAKTRMDPEATLLQNGVRNGDALLLL